MTPFMVKHSEMPAFSLTRQNDDARICANAEHTTTSDAIFPWFLAFKYIYTGQIMCSYSISSKNDLHDIYALLHSNQWQEPNASDTIGELRSSSARTAFVSINKIVPICKTGSNVNSIVVSMWIRCTVHECWRRFRLEPFAFGHVNDFWHRFAFQFITHMHCSWRRRGCDGSRRIGCPALRHCPHSLGKLCVKPLTGSQVQLICLWSAEQCTPVAYGSLVVNTHYQVWPGSARVKAPRSQYVFPVTWYFYYSTWPYCIVLYCIAAYCNIAANVIPPFFRTKRRMELEAQKVEWRRYSRT